MTMDDNQEVFSGEQFTLREPKDINRNIPIEASLDGVTGDYHVKIGLGAPCGSGPTLAAALHAVATQCEVRHLHGSDNLTALAIPDRKLRKCQYCTADIWFALTDNDKWMPLDAEPVHARDLSVGTRRVAVIREGKQNRVKKLDRHSNQGGVWIAHPEVCGISKESPDDKVLIERWETNKEGAGRFGREMLKEICEDITELES